MLQSIVVSLTLFGLLTYPQSLQRIDSDLGHSWQADAPIQVVSHSRSPVYFLNDLLVMNVSEEHITHFQMGWALTGLRDGETVALTTYEGTKKQRAILPRSVATTGVELGSGLELLFSEMKKHPNIQEFTVEIGVLWVKFRNGSEYNFDLKSHGRFLKMKQAEILSLARQLLSEELLRNFAQDADEHARQ